MQRWITALSLTLAVGFQAHADLGGKMHAVYGALGFTEGGIGLGADYEYGGFTSFGVGGLARMYQKDDDRNEPGIMVVGGFIRPHFQKKEWDLYVSPGVAIVNIDSPFSGANQPDDATTLGGILALGLMYELSSSVALGVESMSTWVWFEKDWRGQLIEDFMFRFRVTF